MAGTAKAAVFVGAGKPLEIQEFPIPPVEPGAALISMDMAAICGTDAHAIHLESTPHPVIFGHENIGIIAGLSSEVKEDVLGQPLKEGDRALFRAAPCGQCKGCAMGDRCRNSLSYGFLPSDEPPYLRGGFGQYLYLDPGPWILRVPDDMSSERALLSVVGNHTALHGMEKIGGLTLSDTVVVQGSGPIGIGAMLQARMAGAERVIMIGAPANRLELSTEMGADETIDITKMKEPEARVARIMELTNGQGADMVIECSGAPSAFQEGLEMVAQGGKYLVIGQWTDYGPRPINPSIITRKGIRVEGVISARPSHIIRSLQAMHTMVKYPVEKLITHQFALEDINKGFDTHESLEAMVAVIRPNQ
ncbi:MAG: L-iditol 2-dehydrogenase [Chloroflexi bacterium]|jgi:threonine dehydrogenase-like Zn-dependent dehydrogenase|nr:MAG: L-iditol 2-dehydrogenase [Chloroflexota bacterium]